MIFNQVFLSPQVKGKIVISNKNSIHKWSPKSLKMSGKFKTIGNYCLVPSRPPKIKVFSIIVKIYLKLDIELCYFTWNAVFFSNILFIIVFENIFLPLGYSQVLQTWLFWQILQFRTFSTISSKNWSTLVEKKTYNFCLSW